MKIAMQVTIEVDPDVWAAEYGVDKTEVRADVKLYVQSALYDMPVRPRLVTVR